LCNPPLWNPAPGSRESACERIRRVVSTNFKIPNDGKDMPGRSAQPDAIAITGSETYQALLARAPSDRPHRASKRL